MDGKKLLIVGVDPGITTGYAVLDIEGNLIYLDSSKQLDLSLLISKTIGFGKAVLVGTDKAKVPGLVESFATKLGARVASPEEDLKIEEKKAMVNNFSFNGEHQGDALASALFAYKAARQLLDKIDFFVERNKRESIRDKIKEIVITKRMSIKNAVSMIDKKDEESQIIDKVIVEKRLNETDFLRVYSKLKSYEAEIKIIKAHNHSLKRVISSLQRDAIKKKEAKSDGKKAADFRESRIRFMGNLIGLKEKEIGQLKASIKKLNYVMSNINSYYILKRLGTLGANEFNFKNKILNIQKNDMLLVDSIDMASDSVVRMLKDKVFVIVHKRPVSKKIENALPFVLMSAGNLKIYENGYFGFIEKKHFEAEKSKIDWARKIIDDYKREKEDLISW